MCIWYPAALNKSWLNKKWGLHLNKVFREVGEATCFFYSDLKKILRLALTEWEWKCLCVWKYRKKQLDVLKGYVDREEEQTDLKIRYQTRQRTSPGTKNTQRQHTFMKFIDLWRVKQYSEAKYPKHHSLLENIKIKFKISSLANQETQRHNEE